MTEEKYQKPNYGHAVHVMLTAGYSYTQIAHHLQISIEDAKAFEEMEKRHQKDKEKHKL